MAEVSIEHVQIFPNMAICFKSYMATSETEIELFLHPLLRMTSTGNFNDMMYVFKFQILYHRHCAICQTGTENGM